MSATYYFYNCDTISATAEVAMNQMLLLDGGTDFIHINKVVDSTVSTQENQVY